MLKLIKENKVLIIIVAVVIIAIIVAIKIRSGASIETTSPITGDLVRTVKISGKIVPKEQVELGFETAGTIALISKDVGDEVRRGELLVRMDTSNISTNILRAEAELALAQAELEKLDGAQVYETQIENAKRSLIQTMVDTYNSADDAVYKKTDQLLLNPRSSRPEISPSLNGYNDLRDSIERNRVIIGVTLESWKLLVTDLNPATYTEERLTTSQKYLAQISSYISDIAFAVNTLETSSTLSQATIDTYRDDATDARDNLDNASQNLITAENKLRGYLLEVPVQVARVESARASLLNYRSQLAKTSLVSPIDGIVSKQETKIGQVVSSASNIVSIISKTVEIEAFVPEVLISEVRIGNSASVTLDAYGDQKIFATMVTHIDPAETMRDGVSTYKVKLEFAEADNFIKPGMTTNINIETYRKKGVLIIAERTVFREGDETFVYILSGNRDQQKTQVSIGEKDSSGNVELISQLPSGSKLILDPTNN